MALMLMAMLLLLVEDATMIRSSGGISIMIIVGAISMPLAVLFVGAGSRGGDTAGAPALVVVIIAVVVITSAAATVPVMEMARGRDSTGCHQEGAVWPLLLLLLLLHVEVCHGRDELPTCVLLCRFAPLLCRRLRKAHDE